MKIFGMKNKVMRSIATRVLELRIKKPCKEGRLQKVMTRELLVEQVRDILLEDFQPFPSIAAQGISFPTNAKDYLGGPSLLIMIGRNPIKVDMTSMVRDHTQVLLQKNTVVENRVDNPSFIPV
jgi:hypothetical protein